MVATYFIISEFSLIFHPSLTGERYRNYRYEAFALQIILAFCNQAHRNGQPEYVHGCNRTPPDHNAEKYYSTYSYKDGELIRNFGF